MVFQSSESSNWWNKKIIKVAHKTPYPNFFSIVDKRNDIMLKLRSSSTKALQNYNDLPSVPAVNSAVVEIGFGRTQEEQSVVTDLRNVTINVVD